MRIIAATFAAALLAVTPAAAQQQHQQPHTAAPTSHPAPSMSRPAPSTARPTTHATTAHPTVATHHAVHHVTTHHVTHHVVTHHRVVRTHHVVHTTVRTAVHRAPAAVVARLRRNVVAVHRFHAGPYRAPPGWAYRRWVFGENLPAIYFAPGFWITDFLAFDLFAPPDGYVWVRYGPDALLIDRYTGEIIQVNYGVFF